MCILKEYKYMYIGFPLLVFFILHTKSNNYLHLQNMHSFILSLTALVLSGLVAAAPVITSTNSTLVTRYDHCNRAGVFALTFDDGPSQYSYDLAKVLHQQGIKATFFINGNNTV